MKEEIAKKNGATAAPGGPKKREAVLDRGEQIKQSSSYVPKVIPKAQNIKDLLYHSANTYADNIAFTTKIKNGKEVEYINHTYTNLLENINYFGTSLYIACLLAHNIYDD